LIKSIIYSVVLLLLSYTAKSQYYLRGEIKDNYGQYIQNVRMVIKSTGNLYHSGISGGFGITTSKLNDSLILSYDGFETITVAVNANQYQTIVLKRIQENENKNRQHLTSIARDFNQTTTFKSYLKDESYFTIVENDIVNADKYPNTGVSLNINKASYSNIRRFVNMKSTVPPDAVRIEELLNYFNLNYKEPTGKDVFNITSQFTDCPWNQKDNLLYITVSARKINLDSVPPSNLVFLIDASGSMDLPNRLPLVKAAFQMLVRNLRDIDTVSIVSYGGDVQICLKPTSGAEKEKIIQAIEELNAEGDTPGEAALRTAYQVAKKRFIKGGNNRVILATDGDFNVGEVTEKGLEDLIVSQRQSGLYLTCLGVGMGNFKDSKLETLAKKGNGNYAYLDNVAEAEKVLVKEMTQTFYTVADNVFLNVHFNPSIIKEYRLIGFDNKKEAITDSTGDIEGGEIGSGNSLMAIFEVSTKKGKIKMNDSSFCEPIANVSLKYNIYGDKSPKDIHFSCPLSYTSFEKIDKELQFGCALSMFGMKLRNSKFLPDTEWSEIEKIAQRSYNPEKYMEKDFLTLLVNAKRMYSKKKKWFEN